MSQVFISFDAPDTGFVDSIEVANLHGYVLMMKWLERIPEAQAWHVLFEDGAVEGTDALKEQLEFALEQHPSTNKNVLRTAKHLLEVLGEGHPEEIAIITTNDDE